MDIVHNWMMSHPSQQESAAATGRRERKRRQTHQAIERAAVALACEVGYANVTVAEICERADVSRSTFFNYMPSLDAAIFGPPLRLIPDEAAWAMLDAGADHVPRALNMISLASVAASVGDDMVDTEVMAGRRRLVHEQPDTIPRWEETFSTLRFQLVVLVGRWLAAHPERRALEKGALARETLLLVNASGAVATALMDEWADADPGAAAGPEAFDRVYADLRRVIAAHG